jgi:signal recognition particle subunit SRP54
MEAMICAMTPEERNRPQILNAKRRQRIAKGSGVRVAELNNLMNRFGQMQKMMRKMGKMQKMMGKMGGKMASKMAGRMGAGFRMR